MKTVDIIKQLSEATKSGQLLHDFEELEQLRKQASNELGLQIIFSKPTRTYTVRLTINDTNFETQFNAEPTRIKHQAAVKDALNTVITNAVTSYLLDDANVVSLFMQHFK